MFRGILAALVAISILAGAAPPVSSGGVDETVQVRDNEFDPTVVPSTTNPLIAGESIEWEWSFDVQNPHDVRQVRGLFRSPLSSTPGTLYGRTFSSGKFPYECSIHGPSMAGTVRVVIGQGAAPSGLPLISWADETTNTGRAFDVQFRIDDGPWRLWRKDTGSFHGVFGKNDRPVHYNAANEYWFRVRSQKRAGTPDKVSRWSPARLLD
jgi:plastocyanin